MQKVIFPPEVANPRLLTVTNSLPSQLESDVRIWWLAAAVLASFAAACTSETPWASVSSPTPSFVGWRELPATNVIPSGPTPTPAPPIPIPAGAKACVAGQLEAKLFAQQGAAGHTDSQVDLRNRSGNPCYLEGFPDITILDAAGKVLAQAAGAGQRQTFFGDPPVVPILMETGTPALVSASGPITDRAPKGQAEVHIEWYDCRWPKPARMAIDLPDGGSRLTIDYAVTAPISPGCGNAGAPTMFLARGPFTPTGIVWPPQPNFLALAVTLTAPATAKRGSTVTYFVRVANTSDMNYMLDPCPDYVVYLGETKPLARYQLNCAPVGHIAPGSSVIFDMRLTVPLNMVSGSYQFMWGIFDGRISSELAKAKIEVT